MNFSNSLTQWYLNNKRDLPWRNTRNPYHIWLSEIILQQTRVAQGTPYFLNFIETFPTVFELANAPEEQVLKLWQGLGYYSRARNLHKTAQFVAFERNGIFPNTYIELIKLKGIGEYTAAAIASFAYDEAVPVVDGNVFRVLSRYFDIPTDISLASAKKEFSATAFEVMDKNQPALFNQAIMEFGAIQCVPKNPNCDVCVFNNSCLALQKKNVSERPVKLKKIKIQERHINYLIIIDQNGRIPIQKRTEKGIWQNLYEFPNIETIEFTPDSEIIECIRQNMHFSTEIESVFRLNLNKITHKLSHQHLHINFWEVHVLKDIEGTYERQELIKFPFPIVIYNFIENNYKF